MGARFEPAQVLAPHRSATHILPSRSTSTALVEPQLLPSGSFAQSSTARYGLGSCACACAPSSVIAATIAAKPYLMRLPRDISVASIRVISYLDRGHKTPWLPAATAPMPL